MNQVKPLVIQRKKKDYQRYERPIPGDRYKWIRAKLLQVSISTPLRMIAVDIGF